MYNVSNNDIKTVCMTLLWVLVERATHSRGVVPVCLPGCNGGCSSCEERKCEGCVHVAWCSQDAHIGPAGWLQVHGSFPRQMKLGKLCMVFDKGKNKANLNSLHSHLISESERRLEFYKSFNSVLGAFRRIFLYERSMITTTSEFD